MTAIELLNVLEEMQSDGVDLNNTEVNVAIQPNYPLRSITDMAAYDEENNQLLIGAPQENEYLSAEECELIDW